MAGISTTRKLAIAGRIVAEHAGRSRWVRGAKAGGGAFLKSLLHVIHLLWLEITGLFFILFAVVFLSRTVRHYHAYTAGRTDAKHVAAGVAVTLLFAWFGVTSFLRARRKRK